MRGESWEERKGAAKYNKKRKEKKEKRKYKFRSTMINILSSTHLFLCFNKKYSNKLDEIFDV